MIYKKTSQLRGYIDDIKSDLINSHDDLFELAHKIAEEILKAHYGSLEQVSLPVDIRGIIKSHDIDLAEVYLNQAGPIRLDRVNGFLRYTGMGVQSPEWCIYAEITDEEYVRHFVMAHEFAQYLLCAGGATAKYRGNPLNFCVDPFLPKEPNETLSDIIGTFLLFPDVLVLEALSTYLHEKQKRRDFPLRATDFIQRLSELTQVSIYHTYSCYQFFKIWIAYRLAREENEKIPQEERLPSKYSILFR